jgi:hypothetical protein
VNKTEFGKTLAIIASRTTREEYRKISSVLFGLYCGTTFGFSDSTLGFKSYLDEVYKRTNKDRLAMRGLRVVK